MRVTLDRSFAMKKWIAAAVVVLAALSMVVCSCALESRAPMHAPPVNDPAPRQQYQNVVVTSTPQGAQVIVDGDGAPDGLDHRRAGNGQPFPDMYFKRLGVNPT